MFSAAFRASPDYLTISRLDGHLLEVNPTFERMTGWRRDEAIGAQAVELGLWAFPEEREAMLHELSVHGAVTDFPCTLGTRWKTRRTCLLNVSMVTLENEPCLVGMIHDITEQQAAEKALRDSERKFATIFNLAPFALSLTRVGDRTHVDANPAWERLFGIERNTVLGRTSGEFGCWTDPRAYDDLYARVVSSDVLAQQEIRIRPCNRDDVATCLISGQRLHIRDEACALWSMVDITELRRAQPHEQKAGAPQGTQHGDAGTRADIGHGGRGQGQAKQQRHAGEGERQATHDLPISGWTAPVRADRCGRGRAAAAAAHRTCSAGLISPTVKDASSTAAA